MTDDTGSSESGTESVIDVSPGGRVGFDDLAAIDEAGVEEVTESANKEVATEIAKEAIQEDGEITEETKSKIIKALNGEMEMDIPADVVFKHGEDEATLQQMHDDFIGQKEVDRRMSALDVDKKKFESDKGKHEEDLKFVNGNLKKMVDLTKSGQHWDAMKLMAVMAGQDPVSYQKDFVEQALAVAEKFQGMSEDDAKVFWTDQQNAHLKEQLEEKAKLAETSKASQASQAELIKVIDSYGVEHQGFKKAYEYLRDEGEIEKMAHLTQPEITQKVCEFYQDAEINQRMLSVVKEVDPELANDEKFIDKLFNLLEPEDTAEDIKEILAEYLGPQDEDSGEKVKETSSKKVAPKKKRAASSKRAASKEKKKEEDEETDDVDPHDIVGFDDIIDQYGRA